MHGNNTARYFRTLFPAYAQFQVLLYDATAGQHCRPWRTIPFRWDGTLEDLPAGMDAVGNRAIDDAGPPTALSALAAEVRRRPAGHGSQQPDHRVDGGRCPPRRVDATRRSRPTQLEGPLSADPDRALCTMGASGRAALRSVVARARPPRRNTAADGTEIAEIEAPVSDWEEWTGMQFPEDGEYVFPQGLAPLSVRNGIGSYWEPNIWMRHEV